MAGSAEATGFGIFLAVVLVLQLPIVWFTWRRTATAIVLTRSGALALHRGRTLAEVRWAELERIERVETLGNVRWRLAERDGPHIAVEGEIEDVPGLVEQASSLSGVEPEGRVALAAPPGKHTRMPRGAQTGQLRRISRGA